MAEKRNEQGERRTWCKDEGVCGGGGNIMKKGKGHERESERRKIWCRGEERMGKYGGESSVVVQRLRKEGKYGGERKGNGEREKKVVCG